MGATAGDTTAFTIRSTYQRTLAPGEMVFDAGDAGDKLYVIQSGEVELSREEVGGQRVVARLSAGDFFGELGVVLGQPCSARAIVIRCRCPPDSRTPSAPTVVS